MDKAPTAKKIRDIRTLRDRSSERRKTGLFVAEGERLCAEMPMEDLVEVFMSSGYRASHPTERCDYVLKNGEFEKLADTKHPQGILAVARQRSYELSDVLGGKLYIILDTIQDPGNLGTIVRTAEAAGVTAVIMNKGCAEIYSPKVVRSTMGSIFRVPFLCTDDLGNVIARIKQSGVKIYAADMSGKNISETKLADKRAFIIGNEANGITGDVLKLADEKVSIPMAGKVKSLNAAVSSAILMYQD